jgi:hypothetical protein
VDAQGKGKPVRHGEENISWCRGYHMMYISLYLGLKEVKLLIVGQRGYITRVFAHCQP